MVATGTAHKQREQPIARPRRWLAEVPHIAGLVVGIFATLCFVWSISPLLRVLSRPVREYLDAYYVDAPDTSLAWALVLGLLAAALASRKRIAWWLLTGYLVGITALNVKDVLGRHDLNAAAAAVVHLAVLAVLLAAHRQFYTRVRPGALWRALGVLLAGLALGTLLGWGLLELFPGTLPQAQRPFWALNRVTARVFADNHQFDGHAPIFVNALLGLFGAIALLVAVITLFRSQRAANALTGNDESALRGLLQRYGGDDSLGYFATRRDKAVVFAPSGKAAVTYRVEVGVCLASGDPIGEREAWPHAIAAWLELADRYGWAPAVMGAGELGATAYRRAGLSVLQLGDEAILYPDSFRLTGPEMKPVRQAANRLARQGVTVRIRRHRDIDPDEMKQVIARADRWRDTETERGFSMALGRLGDPLDGDCLLVEALAPNNTAALAPNNTAALAPNNTEAPAAGEQQAVLGMLSLVPWGTNGVSLDLMRRDPRGPNGVMELMISDLARTADRHGITKISLNFAVFRSAFEEGGRIGAGPILRLWRGVLLFFSRWWQLEALYRSNVKYRPDWVPRYLCFPDNRELPRVGIAGALAEGFLPHLGGEQTTRHTGTHDAAPATLTGLHADGSAPGSAESTALPTPAARPARVHRPEQVRVRMAKLDRLAASGVDPYPTAQPPTHTVAAARACPLGTPIRIAGRLLRIRDYGGVTFAVVRDWSGDLQLLIDRARVGAESAATFTADFDLGDLIEVSGVLGHSRSGELSLLADAWRMTGKCLHPLPEKWKGLQDPEARVRQRYVDLAINPEIREILVKRSAVTRSLRTTLTGWGYLEVETPILQRVHGGANAKPFTTHINAYDLDLYLRIAPELYLKRLCVGGVEKVFELGRTFRNEGVDQSHNPEFTILEAYEAHADYLRMLTCCRELIQAAAVAANGRCIALRPGPDGGLIPVDISGEWPVRTMHAAISAALGTEVTPDTPLAELRRLCDDAAITYQSTWDAGHVALEMYEHLVEAHTEEPTFYTDFPVSVSPLTRSHRSVPGVTERWDLVAWGTELATAYSELTDPIEQRRRLTAQSLLAAGGDAEAMELDEEFLTALEHAMPPTGGLGMGVDRIVMLLTGRGIRETLPFPLVR
ncbi:bifunctional lysylphosphatidylglycerol synthetase/lysine--tRNA ligase LysX [Skermania piniformis]|uniref:Lysine--tRNA ligase n=2 Tax=Skermania pinensis TaxID=39122 RepID=A0ABX8SAE8_9ACTN|nr:bifunctional lysylphosphatidylglycerol synthetase/lysine--tRNA ligase LysX [Skermania piniformis]QXQ13967.1 bifunctional lysylphosphatidylglycerol synthetase/lysine--tRNA ligase LysX [Skermania piniformis]